ncbi:demethylmenaquinone methyltransferase [Abditibacteriota bacterium]|nr:demethylmenaquinone methyltransferase [Abditibacteriota bacterium]
MNLPQPDKSSAAVRAMFDDIAPTYDLLNGLLSANQDALWRYRAAKRLCVRKGERVLDLCCGTGDLTREIARQAPGSEVMGADFSSQMLDIARRKDASHQYMEADALALPFGDGEFNAVSVAFGVRNFEDTGRGLREIARVLKPGGRLLVLEFMRPTNPALGRFFGVFNAALAPLGRVISKHSTAYNYLPQSVGGFYSKGEFAQLLGKQGFRDVRSFDHSFGIASSFLARKGQFF